MRKAPLAFAAGRFVRAVVKNRQHRAGTADKVGMTDQAQGSSTTAECLHAVRNGPIRTTSRPGARRPVANYVTLIFLGFGLIGAVEILKLWLGF